MRSAQRVAGYVLVVVAAVSAVLTLGCLTWAVFQTFLRPPNYAEACVLFNAARMREGLPLYVDPSVGAHEYGAPPSRYFVAYTPLFAGALAALTTEHALRVGRLVGLIAWYGALAIAVWTARPACRRNATVGGLFVGASFLFALGSVCVKPDAIALLLAAIALMRALDRGRVDGVSGALFALAGVLKPSVIGMGIGAVAASTILIKDRRWSALASGGAVVAGIVAVLHVVSGGVAVRHLRAALGLVFGAERMLENILSRGPFVAGLVMAAFVAAYASARSASGASGRIALVALSSSVVVACIGFGKAGAASNYLMESALACVVVLSRLPLPPPRTLMGKLALTTGIIVTFAWASNATVRSLYDEAGSLGSYGPALGRIRTRCLDRPHAFVVSSDPGIEFALNGRIHTHGLELWNESRLGHFPAALWAADMRDANVRCVVTWTGDSPAPPQPGGPFPAEVAEVFRDRLLLPTLDSGYAIYPVRDR